MDQNLREQNLDLSEFSKPITVVEEKLTWWQKFTRNLLGQNKEINVTEEENKANIQTAPVEKPVSSATTEVKKEEQPIKELVEQDEKNREKAIQKQELAKNYSSRLTDSTKGKEFFEKTKQENKKSNSSWIKSEVKSTESNIVWVVKGSIIAIAVIIISLGGFALFNWARVKVTQPQPDAITMLLAEAKKDLADGRLEPAKLKTESILEKQSTNSEAKTLLSQINEARGKKVADQFAQLKNIDITKWDKEIYKDESGVFSIGKDKRWQAVKSDYDVKYTDNQSSFALKKYPATNSIMDMSKNLQDSLLLQKKSIIYKNEILVAENLPGQIIVSEDKDYFIASLLVQQHQYGLEISNWINKKTETDGIASAQKFVKSLSIAPTTDLPDYDKLITFGDDKISYHVWPDSNAINDQQEISDNFKKNLEQITQALKLNWNKKIDVYLYPNQDIRNRYSLSKKSFSDASKLAVHIVYENKDSRESYGYETAKVIIQNTFGQVKEPLLLHGISAMFDGMGRDYLNLVRNGNYTSITKLADGNWDLIEGDAKYFTAEVFVKHLVDKYGIDLFINLIKEKEFPGAYTKIYNKDLSKLENELRSELNIN